MHKLSVVLCNLALPVELRFGKHVLLQKVMRLNDDKRCGSLKANAALYTNDCISNVHISSNAIRSSNCGKCPYYFNRCELLAIERYRLALHKLY